jgi:hypothetical protein
VIETIGSSQNGWLETLPFTCSASVRERPGTVELILARRRLGRSASLIGVRYPPSLNWRTRTWTETWPIWGRKFEGQVQTNFKKQAIGPGDLASDWPSKADRLWIHKAGGAHDDLIQSCPRRISCKRWSLAIRDVIWNSGRRRLSDSGVRRLGRGSRR